MSYTKVICTIGPCTNSADMLKKLAKRGMTVVRINMSHGNWEQHHALLKLTRKVSDEIGSQPGYPTCLSVMLDTKGPEIRSGVVEKPVEIKAGQEVVFSYKPLPKEKLPVVLVNYPEFGEDAIQSDPIIVDNGKMSFKPLTLRKDGSIVARSNDTGSISSKRHINLPGVYLQLPSVTKQDWIDIGNGADAGADCFALSFVRCGKDIEDVRKFLNKRKSTAKLIAKIETKQAVENMDEIIAASDGIMVARGDLGSEVPFESVPVIQSQLVARTRAAGKPVIVATHMLESMIDNPMPTRAEVTDIAHAATTGTDCTMLSGETANGQHPLLALEAMERVLATTEEHLMYELPRRYEQVQTEREARAEAAVTLAVTMQAAAIVVMTRTGQVARDIARYRPMLPMFAFTPTPEVQRSLQLTFGAQAFAIAFNEKDPELAVEAAYEVIRKRKLLPKGSRLVVVSDTRAHDHIVSSIQMRTI